MAMAMKAMKFGDEHMAPKGKKKRKKKKGDQEMKRGSSGSGSAMRGGFGGY